MGERYGLWPGVVAIVGGAAVVQAVIDGLPGYERLTGQEGNPLSVVLYGSEDLRGMCCADCFTLLEDEDGYEWQAMT